jgi:arylsulfatase A-like enzyme
VYDNSLIIVTADHGEAIGEHGHLSHGGVSVYGEQIAVPLLIKFPGQQQAEDVDTVVSQVDLMPTIMDVAGIQRNLPFQGESLRTVQVRNPARLVYSTCYPFVKWIQRSPKFDRTLRAVVAANWKLILSNSGERELYDTAADPREQTNLVRIETSRAEALETALSQWLSATPVEQQGSGLNATQDNMRRLKSLGYAQ